VRFSHYRGKEEKMQALILDRINIFDAIKEQKYVKLVTNGKNVPKQTGRI
jgi:hypothetical protein